MRRRWIAAARAADQALLAARRAGPLGERLSSALVATAHARAQGTDTLRSPLCGASCAPSQAASPLDEVCRHLSLIGESAWAEQRQEAHATATGSWSLLSWPAPSRRWRSS